MVQHVLEDFDVIATRQFAALVRRRPHLTHFADNVRAAVVASTLGLASLDYAKRRYCDGEEELERASLPVHAYVEAYQFTRSYLERLTTSLQTKGKPEATVGVFGASIVLERSLLSFFCAHLMYQMGYRYEGHAISRVILEQIAWAFEAHEARDIETIQSIRTTAAVSKLKRFAPEAGALYGFLSKKTHIDYSSHSEFLRVEDGKNAVVYGHDVMPEYGSVILRLGDLFSLVWEASQFPYLTTPEAVEARHGTLAPKLDRAYLVKMHDHMNNIEEAVRQARETTGQTDSTVETDARKGGARSSP
jgi:hypothetical protein